MNKLLTLLALVVSVTGCAPLHPADCIKQQLSAVVVLVVSPIMMNMENRPERLKILSNHNLLKDMLGLVKSVNCIWILLMMENLKTLK